MPYFRATWRNLATNIAAPTAAPATAADGLPIDRYFESAESALVRVRHQAAGARQATIEIFGYVAHAIGPGGATIANSGGWARLSTIALDETDDTALSVEVRTALAYARIACRVTALVGAPTISIDYAPLEEA